MTFRCVQLLAVLLLGLFGCQTYEPQPLDLEGYAANRAGRALDLEPIRRYADALTESRGGPFPWDTADGLSLVEAEAVALHFNPQLRQTRARAELPLAAAREAGWWPDPKFEAEVLRILQREVDGESIEEPWIVGANLRFTIPISGRLGVAQDLRWSEYRASWRQILVEEWELITRLREAWFKWSAATRKSATVREFVGRLEVVSDAAEKLVAAGEMKPSDGRLLLIELARLRADLLRHEHKAQQDRQELLALMGLDPNVSLRLHSELTVIPIGVPREQRRAGLLAHDPRIQAARADYEAAEQRLRLEIRRQYPDLEFGPALAFEDGLTRLGFGFGLPIPLWNRNRQAIEQALAARDVARAQAEAVVEEALSSLALAELRLESLSLERAALLQNVAPLVEEQVRDSRKLLELGEVDVLLLRDALAGSLETRLNLLETTLSEASSANQLQQMLAPRWFTPARDRNLEEQR